MCFERAGDRHWEIYAKAAGLKAAAGRTYELNPEEASSILRQAAELFESINVYRKAADCFYELKEYDRAGLPLCCEYYMLPFILDICFYLCCINLKGFDVV